MASLVQFEADQVGGWEQEVRILNLLQTCCALCTYLGDFGFYMWLVLVEMGE